MLKITKFQVNPFAENCYLLYHSVTKTATIIDPGQSSASEYKVINQYIADKELKIERILLTHAHIDHVLGVQNLQFKYQCPVLMHSLEESNLKSGEVVSKMYGLGEFNKVEDFETIDELTEISIADFTFKIMFVPGHSAGHLAFYQAESNILIAGDVLFEGSIGRTDLPGGDFKTLERSIKTHLYALPDETVVYPGHGNHTGIGYEKKNNPFVKA